MSAAAKKLAAIFQSSFFGVSSSESTTPSDVQQQPFRKNRHTDVDNDERFFSLMRDDPTERRHSRNGFISRNVDVYDLSGNGNDEEDIPLHVITRRDRPAREHSITSSTKGGVTTTSQTASDANVVAMFRCVQCGEYYAPSIAQQNHASACEFHPGVFVSSSAFEVPGAVNDTHTLSLCFSVSIQHTHTHTHTRRRCRERDRERDTLS